MKKLMTIYASPAFLACVDEAARKSEKTRNAFVETALQEWLENGADVSEYESRKAFAVRLPDEMQSALFNAVCKCKGLTRNRLVCDILSRKIEKSEKMPLFAKIKKVLNLKF